MSSSSSIEIQARIDELKKELEAKKAEEAEVKSKAEKARKEAEERIEKELTRLETAVLQAHQTLVEAKSAFKQTKQDLEDFKTQVGESTTSDAKAPRRPLGFRPNENKEKHAQGKRKLDSNEPTLAPSPASSKEKADGSTRKRTKPWPESDTEPEGEAEEQVGTTSVKTSPEPKYPDNASNIEMLHKAFPVLENYATDEVIRMQKDLKNPKVYKDGEYIGVNCWSCEEFCPIVNKGPQRCKKEDCSKVKTALSQYLRAQTCHNGLNQVWPVSDCKMCSDAKCPVSFCVCCKHFRPRGQGLGRQDGKCRNKHCESCNRAGP